MIFAGLLLSAVMSFNVGVVVFRRGLPELRIWVYGNLSLLAAFLYLILDRPLPGPLGVGLHHGLSLLTLVSFILASSTLLGAPRRRLPLLVLAALTAAAAAALTAAGGERWMRLALVSLAITAFSANAACFAVRRAREVRLKNGPGLLSALFVLAALFFLVRGLAHFAYRSSAPFGLSEETADALSNLAVIVLFAAMDFALLLILMTRVEREVTGKVLELGESRNNLQILYDAFAETAGSVDLEELIPRLLDLLHNNLKVDAAILYLGEARSGELSLVAQRGLSTELLESLLHRQKGESIADIAYAEGRSVSRLLADYRDGPIKAGLVGLGLGVTAAFPILARGEVLGALAVGFRDPAFLDEPRTVLFETMTQQLGSVVRAATLHAELERANARLDILASTDALTHLPNRRTALRVLDREISRARRLKGKIAVIMADLDHFKVFNDRYGHDCGDYVLSRTASLLAESLRSTDLASRWGGEEFLLILGSADPEGVIRLAERIKRRVENAAWEFRGQSLSVTLTLGIAICPPELGGDAAVSAADEALYEGKRQGRNRVALFAWGEGGPRVVELEADESLETLPRAD